MPTTWLLLGLGLVLLLAPLLSMHRRFLDALVMRWAAGQNVEVIGYRWRPLMRGPFFRELMCGFDHTEVFEVRVRDLHGRVRTAWICCYIPLAMLPSCPEAQHVDVRWMPQPVA